MTEKKNTIRTKCMKGSNWIFYILHFILFNLMNIFDHFRKTYIPWNHTLGGSSADSKRVPVNWGPLALFQKIEPLICGFLWSPQHVHRSKNLENTRKYTVSWVVIYIYYLSYRMLFGISNSYIYMKAAGLSCLASSTTGYGNQKLFLANSAASRSWHSDFKCSSCCTKPH
jgi:hypothetical protein